MVYPNDAACGGTSIVSSLNRQSVVVLNALTQTLCVENAAFVRTNNASFVNAAGQGSNRCIHPGSV